MRNKNIATALSFLLGIVGMQFFYLGRVGLGIMCCAFTFYWKVDGWMVSVLIGVINAILFSTMTDEEFDRRYNKSVWKQRRGTAHYDEPKKTTRNTKTGQTQNATTTKQSDLSALKQSGIKKFKDHDYQGAIGEFDQVLQLDPRDVSVHFNLACCHSLLEHIDASFFHLQQAVELGFKDMEKIKTHEALAHLRVQPEFESFFQNGCRMSVPVDGKERVILKK